MKILTLTFLAVILCFGCTFQKKENLIVVNYGNKIARAEFEALELDSVYVNLLTTAQTEEEGDTLYKRWLSFHKDLAKRVKEEKFDWGKKDSSVIIWDRVYCDPDGKIEYYVYNIIDTIVTEECKVAFGQLVKSFDPPLKYNVSRESKYAQCGSYRYYVY
jgi:hypothetical protein